MEMSTSLARQTVGIRDWSPSRSLEHSEQLMSTKPQSSGSLQTLSPLLVVWVAGKGAAKSQ
jgi:hypothetical protein